LALIRTRTLYRSGFYSKSLTNYFIASNQIVKQLRSTFRRWRIYIRKIWALPASKAVWVTPASAYFPSAQTRVLGKRSGTA